MKNGKVTYLFENGSAPMTKHHDLERVIIDWLIDHFPEEKIATLIEPKNDLIRRLLWLV